MFFPAIEFLGAIATVAVLGVGGHMVTVDTLSIGTLVSAVFLLNLVFQPLQELSDLYGQVQSAGAAMEKITTVLDTEPLIRDEPGSVPAPRVDGDLHIDHVTFAYGRDPVLHALDIHVPAGGCLAIVGESGGGKSTTAKLVGRFYDPDDGVVRVDGRDLRELQLRSYRRQLGVVLQDPFLFAGTIADNIRFAQPDATDEQVEDVARAVGVDRIARRFERGLLHEVREGGSGLSAGERQLISIARALLADPRILILDEATSNIDRPTEVLIESALDRLLRGRTSIIIAHRLATVRRADEMIVARARPHRPARCVRRAPRSRRAVPRARDSATGFGSGAARAVEGSRDEQLGERRQLVAGVAADEELVDAAEVRHPGNRELVAARIGELRVRHARVRRARLLADEAGLLEPVEQARDPRRGQENPLREIDPPQHAPSACDRCSSTS